MKLDATDLRYVTSEDFRVLTAVLAVLPGCIRSFIPFNAG